ncbi:MAG: hypothetical protein V4850_19640 [Myxococcota bacterium]
MTDEKFVLLPPAVRQVVVAAQEIASDVNGPEALVLQAVAALEAIDEWTEDMAMVEKPPGQ